MEGVCQGRFHWSYGFLGVASIVGSEIGLAISLGEVKKEIKGV